MYIHQHNYEEFFLLYVDRELSEADRQAVEQFVQGNPGLADELEMLQQMKLPQEAVLFGDKDLLYRDAVAGISLTNYEDRFLLYVDNELDAVAREQVETFVLQHPALQEDFTLLKQTRLEPETILFPDKQSLYRATGKQRRVFYLGWQRMAAAAAFTGLAILVWTLFTDRNALPEPTLAQQQPPLQKNRATSQPAEQGSRTRLQPGDNNTVTAAPGPVPAATVNKVQPKAVVEDVQPELPNTLARNDIRPSVQQPENTVTGKNNATEATRAAQQLPENNALTAGNSVTIEKPADEVTTANPLAQQAVYKELDTDDEKKSLYLGSIEINKDKLRGFFRKATSLFRGKAKQEDDRTEGTPSTNTRSLK